MTERTDQNISGEKRKWNNCERQGIMGKKKNKVSRKARKRDNIQGNEKGVKVLSKRTEGKEEI